MSMIFNRILQSSAIVAVVFSGTVLAQDDAPDTVVVIDDGLMDQEVPVDDGGLMDQEVPVDDGGLMDQVVPVAEEDAASNEAEVAGPPPQTDIDPKTELLQQFENYKRLMQEGIYDEADSVAKRIVTLAIEITGPRSSETAKALTNLGIVQHRNQQFDAAQQNFETAIDIIEDIEDRLNDRLINPLKGLGAAQLEAGRPDLAANTFSRAVHITHVNDGPHNMGQIEILESLAETSLRLGSVEEARAMHDKIYMLHQRRYEDDQLALIPSLMRRAEWQHGAGYITDEQATYRRTIRIIESNADKTDIRLIDPLTKLGQSYFFTDMHEDQGLHHNPVTGEIYFKRALRIAEAHPESNWFVAANSKLALGDYYLMQGTHTRARKLYGQLWEALSDSEDKLMLRDEALGHIAPLNERPIPEFAGGAKAQPMNVVDGNFGQGSVTISFSVTERGRVIELQLIEVQPAEFTDMQRLVHRELRSRIYRPMHEDSDAVKSTDHVFTHLFYYTQSDLDERRKDVDGDQDAESS